jgi:restriction endonuclease S subunit
MWKLELDGHYFKIYDKRKNLVGYFAPEYGNIYPKEKTDEIIEQMHKNHEKIEGGYLMIPMIKFGIFDGRDMNLEYLVKQLGDVKIRLDYWIDFVSSNRIQQYQITVSHTDSDMLSITLHMVFSSPIELEKNVMQNEIAKILDPLQSLGLL